MIKYLFTAILVCAAILAKAQSTPPKAVEDLIKKHGCNTCHHAEKKIIGPAWKLVAAKGYSKKQFAQLVHETKPENWPDYPPMAPMPNVPKSDLYKIAEWVNTLKKS